MPLLFTSIIIVFLLTQQVLVSSHSILNHVVINELQSTGTTATDEFVELFNPTDCPVALDGWKLTRKTSSGAESNLVSSLSGTIPAHGYFLIAHQTGYIGTVSPDLYYSGASYSYASNNTVLLYADQGKNVLIDKVGFGAAVDFEESPAGNPAAGTSLARLDGQDSDNNAADLAASSPSPANSSSNLLSNPGVCFSPPPPPPSPSFPSSPNPNTVVAGLESIAAVRSKSPGQTVSTVGIVTAHPGQLSNSYFYVQDQTAGIQIYSSSKQFPHLTIGDQVSVQGIVSEANGERRIKISAAADVLKTGRSFISPLTIRTRDVGETLEGQLVKATGRVEETSGGTFNINDGTFPARILIREETNIDKPRMKRGDLVTVVGIVSQYRANYRILPRIQEDIVLSIINEGLESDEDEEGGTISSNGTVVKTVAGVTFSPIAGEFSALADQPPWVKVLAWGAIGFGGLLLALLPFLLWAKRSGWKLPLPSKQRSSSENFPKR